ncbi:MAG: zinc-dependent metalloprotease family protein [Myxococcota bacterium]
MKTLSSLHPGRGWLPWGVSLLALAVGACGSETAVDDDEPEIETTSGAAGGSGGMDMAAGGRGGSGGNGGSADDPLEPVASEVELIDLGQVAQPAGFATFTFTIEEGTTSFALSFEVEPDAPVEFLFLQRVTGPSGVLAEVDLESGVVIGDFQTSPTNVPNAAYSLLFPNTPTLEVEPGTYEVTLSGFTEFGPAAAVRGTLMVKRAAAPPPFGSYALDVWFADNDLGLSAATAPEDADFQAALTELRAIHRNAGLTIEDVAYRDIVGAPELGILDNQEELTRLLEIPNVERNGRVSLIMVESIDLNEQGVILGLASGAPGPASVATAPHASVVVSSFGFQLAPERVGKTMAHEIGHQLGLDHTTESDGVRHDPIPDTPECTETVMGFAVPELCPTGGSNFMFWTGFQDNRPQQDVSLGQRLVINGNPSVANRGERSEP